MRQFIIAAMLAGVMVNPVAAAPNFQTRCQSELPKVSIVLRAEENGYKIINNVSARVLSERGAHSYSSELLMGMTDLKSAIEIGFDGPVIEDAKTGQECLSPHVEVVIRYYEMKVFIAREFSEYSCSYRNMLEHEMQHVKIYQEQLPFVAKRVEQALLERFGAQPLVGKRGHLKAEIDRELEVTWLPYIRRELNLVEKMQHALDSDEETHRLSNICSGEAASRLAAIL